MKLKNNSDKVMTVYNGVTYIRVESGAVFELEEKRAKEVLANFAPLLSEAKEETKKKAVSKKAPKKGKDKKMEKLED